MKDKVFLLCDTIREIGFSMHQFFGPGHMEKVYENAYMNRIKKAGIRAQQQHPITVNDEDGTVVGEYIADLLIENMLLVELKATRTTCDEHVAQLLGYMRASQIEHGLLINFGSEKFFIKKFVLSNSMSS